jgi:hypothetical protein
MKTSWVLRRSFFALLCMGVATVPAAAQVTAPTTAAEDARAIIIAGNTEKTLDYMFTQLVPIMEAGFLGQIGQIAGGADLIKLIDAKYPGGQAAFGKRFGELIMLNFKAAYPAMLDEAAQQYVAEISPTDLATIRAFMESRAGQSLATAQPKIQQKLGLSGQEIGRKAGEKAAVELMAEAGQYFGNDK